jgi:hypothetical protein
MSQSIQNSFVSGMYGYFPIPWNTPRISQGEFNLVKTGVTPGALGLYPYIYGNMTYQILDWGSSYTQLIQSNHMGASWGRNLTNSDLYGLSWSYVGGGVAVSMDANSLSAMFPGLVIGLNNGSGNQYYLVTGVFPHNSLDGGTHPGYVQLSTGIVSPLENGVPGPGGNGLAGTIGTTYTTTGSPHGEVAQINQQPFSWNTLSVLQSFGTPTIGTCGTSPSVIGTNSSGTFTTGSSATPTSCTVTFVPAFPNSSTCTLSPANAAAAAVVGGTSISSTASSFTAKLGTGTNSAKYNYICQGS